MEKYVEHLEELGAEKELNDHLTKVKTIGDVTQSSTGHAMDLVHGDITPEKIVGTLKNAVKDMVGIAVSAGTNYLFQIGKLAHTLGLHAPGSAGIMQFMGMNTNKAGGVGEMVPRFAPTGVMKDALGTNKGVVEGIMQSPFIKQVWSSLEGRINNLSKHVSYLINQGKRMDVGASDVYRFDRQDNGMDSIANRSDTDERRMENRTRQHVPRNTMRR